jgi:hypothetical protein
MGLTTEKEDLIAAPLLRSRLAALPLPTSDKNSRLGYRCLLLIMLLVLLHKMFA